MYVDSHSLGQLALASKRTAGYTQVIPVVTIDINCLNYYTFYNFEYATETGMIDYDALNIVS